MIINIFAVILSILPVLWIAKLFIYDPYKSNKIYQLYELRDELSLLAMSNKISEYDADYRLLILLINSEINIRKKDKDSFSITQYIHYVISPQTSSKNSISRFESLAKNEILSPYTQKVIQFTSNRLDTSLRKLKVCITIIELMELLINHNTIKAKQHKTQVLSEYNKIKKQYGEIVNIIT